MLETLWHWKVANKSIIIASYKNEHTNILIILWDDTCRLKLLTMIWLITKEAAGGKEHEWLCNKRWIFLLLMHMAISSVPLKKGQTTVLLWWLHAAFNFDGHNIYAGYDTGSIMPYSYFVVNSWCHLDKLQLATNRATLPYMANCFCW